MKNLFIICFFAWAFSASALPNDSIGTKTVNGKTYILHKVSKGEGVYGIGKRYGVPASEIFASNEGSDKSIKIGQVLLIPKVLSGMASSGNSASETVTTKTEKVYHVVTKGQTLSQIAKMHSTTIAEIKDLNNLKSDNIQLGQKLIVGEKTITVASSKPKQETQKTTPKSTDNPNDNTVVSSDQNAYSKTETSKASETQKNVVVNPVTEAPVADNPGTVSASYSTDDGDEISENGTAVISSEGELSQERSFILHPTAKIGTIVMITNPANNNTVFARVVGNCKTENGIILKMSKTVATKLGVSESTEVKVSYAK